MITHIRISQNIYLVPIVAMAILGVVLLFPAVNYASSEPENQSTTNQTENHNRLINESSPYLLQHATNPVDWFPWGTEAFDIIDVVSIQPGPIRSEIWNKNADSLTEFADSDYAHMIGRVNEMMKQAQQDALPAEVVARLIHKIINSSRPRTQYIVHSRRLPVMLVAKWLPARWVDRMLNRKLR